MILEVDALLAAGLAEVLTAHFSSVKTTAIA
jgi:hypothetical protein